jgi:hypothetical protein
MPLLARAADAGEVEVMKQLLGSARSAGRWKWCVRWLCMGDAT